MDKTAMNLGLKMTAKLVRKPAIGNVRTERLKITLAGSHTMKQKLCMMTQAKFWLHEHGIDNAGISDWYVPLLDPNGYSVTHFPDGTLITDFNLLIESPYHCAADLYQP